MTSKAKQLLISTTKAAIALGLLVYLFASGKVDPESLRAIATLQTLVVGFLITGLILFFASERWRLLIFQQGLSATAFGAFRLTLIGTFFNFFVPGGVGGDLMKAVLIAQHHPEKRSQAALTVVVDRILGLFTMTVLALVAFAFEIDLLSRETSFQLIFILLLGLFVCFLIAFWLIASKRMGALRKKIESLLAPIPRIQKLWIFVQTYHLSGLELLKLSAFSLGAQITQVLLFYVIAVQALGSQIPPLSVFLFAVPVGFMVTAIPLAPAGIGIGQAAFLYLFSKVMQSESQIGVMGITAFQAFQLLYGLVGAGFFVLLRKKPTAL